MIGIGRLNSLGEGRKWRIEFMLGDRCWRLIGIGWFGGLRVLCRCRFVVVSVGTRLRVGQSWRSWCRRVFWWLNKWFWALSVDPERWYHFVIVSSRKVSQNYHPDNNYSFATIPPAPNHTSHHSSTHYRIGWLHRKGILHIIYFVRWFNWFRDTEYVTSTKLVMVTISNNKAVLLIIFTWFILIICKLRGKFKFWAKL